MVEEGQRSATAVALALGVAVIGMIVADVLGSFPLSWSQPEHWHAVAVGRAAVCFVVFGGVALGLSTGGAALEQGQSLVSARLAVLVRAGLLFVLGGALLAVTESQTVILESFAVLVALAIGVLGWRPRRLLIAAAILGVVGPLVVGLFHPTLADRSESIGAIPSLALTHTYPVLIWAPFLLVGVAIGRTDLTAFRTRNRLLGFGFGAAILGYGAIWLLGLARNDPEASRMDSDWTEIVSECVLDTDSIIGVAIGMAPDPALDSMLAAGPSSPATILAIIGSAGVAALILGLVLAVPQALWRWLAPVTAVGSLPLTAYTAAILGTAGLPLDTLNRSIVLITELAVLAVGAHLWLRVVGRGPIEWLIDLLVAAATRIAPASRPGE
ncbi:DUF418 domain-containing protein [Nocardia sp. CDC159]|uniref:DUF418 domain-containing protein n=1 Tax=Nocardia pulmonis TaxID=2951408 RepID=A0A9X2EC19_9NOCA|nr:MULTISPECIES: DUF418 domain-containing protein [Nocardia]MCM6777591.1 DUF418 domain-containing protein [Nocardia pulmonis]MCM6790605.1 DUF418 domain-containing protein [Nocardia sp. CDC159]